MVIRMLHDELEGKFEKNGKFLPVASTLPVSRQGKRGRHFVVFRQTEDLCIDVLRLLHDAMDLARLITPTPFDAAPPG
jgi:plasmid stabilization system protein ParE